MRRLECARVVIALREHRYLHAESVCSEMKRATTQIMPREQDRFDVQVMRDGAGKKVLVKFRGRIVRTVTGADADLIADAVAAGDDDALQLLVARKTGNFKRGNER